MNFKKILSLYTDKLYKEFSLIPIVGCELEFYTHLPHDKLACRIGLEVTPEEGQHQAEVRFPHTHDSLELGNQIESTRQEILAASAQQKAWTSFAAKPFLDEPGSAMHIHLNFMNGKGKNANSKYLNYAIAGLLQTLKDFMVVFAPNESSYARFVKSMTSPTNISWGRNNRTAALRLITGRLETRRIEHRVPGADAQAHAVLAAVMFGAYLGIKDQLRPIAETHGLTFDEQYNLTPLITNLAIAKQKFKACRCLNASLTDVT